MSNLQQHDKNLRNDVEPVVVEPILSSSVPAHVAPSVDDHNNCNISTNAKIGNNENGVIALDGIEILSSKQMVSVVQPQNSGNVENASGDSSNLEKGKQKAFLSNQETETVAMVDDLINALTPPITTINILQHSTVGDAKEEVEKTNEENTVKTSKSGDEVLLASNVTAQSAPVEFRIPAITYGMGSLKNTRRKKNLTTLNGPSRSLTIGSEAIRMESGGSRNILSCSCVINASDNVAYCSKCLTNIKTSLSMTSLPPDEKHQQGREVIKDKLKIERPYNSLKKNADRCNSITNSNLNGSTSITNKQLHRYSWGSGYSQSSSSFHEDFISLSFQTNYNYIMDTNLLDTCKEARCEIEHGAANVLQNTTDGCCFKMLDGSNRSDSSFKDPQTLRKWLREMEQKLETAPSVSQATLFSIADLQRHLSEHSVLYHEIVSHARVVTACIRTASEKLQQNRDKAKGDLFYSKNDEITYDENEDSSLKPNNALSPSLTEEEATTRTPSSGIEISTSSQEPLTPTVSGRNKKCSYRSTIIPSSASSTTSSTTSSSGKRPSSIGNSEVDSLDRLQNRYHLLYLKAFEVQLWLDGLLRKKSSSVSSDYDDDDEVDVDIDDDDEDVDDDKIHGVGEGTIEYDINDLASDLDSDVVTKKSLSLSYCDLERSASKNTNASKTSKSNKHVPKDKNNEKVATHSICSLNEAVGSTKEETFHTQKHKQQHTKKRDCIPKKVDSGNYEPVETEEEFEADDEDELDSAYRNRGDKHSKLSCSGVLLTYDKSVVLVNDKEIEDATTFGGISMKKPPSVTLTDFEADSESSDWEVQLAQRHQQQLQNRKIVNSAHQHELRLNLGANTVTENAPVMTALNSNTTFHEKSDIASNNMIHNTESLTQNLTFEACKQLNNTNIPNINEHQNICEVKTQSSMTIVSSSSLSQSQMTLPRNQQQHQMTNTTLPPHNNSNCNQKLSPNDNGANKFTLNAKQKNIAIISPNQHNANAASPKTPPTVLRKRHVDISKFNRSNRKSKNCAIFYFRHLDTDNETNYGALSSSASHMSDLMKSADTSSDDDGGWLYSSAANPNTSETANAINKHKTDEDSSIDCLNSSIDIQSSDVSSSTNGSASAKTATADDSDKETKKTDLASVLRNFSTSSTTQIATQNLNTCISGTSTNNSSINSSANRHSGEGIKAVNDCHSIGDAHLGNCDSSSSSSNGILTDTTATTQIRKTHCKQQKQQQLEKQSDATDGAFRSEMEIQIIGNGGLAGGNNSANSKLQLYHCQQSNKNINNNNNNNNNSINNNFNNENNTDNDDNSNNNHHEMEKQNIQQQPPLHHKLATDEMDGKSSEEKTYFHTRADICNITVEPLSTEDANLHRLGLNHNGSCQSNNNNSNKRLPPRSPAKSGKSFKSVDTVSTLSLSPAKGKVSHESIKQLVLKAEHLVREEILTSPSNYHLNQQQKLQKHHKNFAKILSTVKKQEVVMPGPIKKRVQEWLEHQPPHPMHNLQSHRSSHDSTLNAAGVASERTDDCEASGEASDTDSIAQHGSDTSDGFTDSIATCMQTSTNSFGNSTERIGGSAEPICGVPHTAAVSANLMTTSTSTNATAASTTTVGEVGGGGGGCCGSSNQSLNIKTVKRRQQKARPKSERPWSVSCLSQLTNNSSQAVTASSRQVAADVQAGLATHSISESALDSLSPSRRPRTSSTVTHAKNYDSKGSLKRRKTRKKKSLSSSLAATGMTFLSGGKKTDSGSDIGGGMVATAVSKSLQKSGESMSPQQIQEITTALLGLQKVDGKGSLPASSAAVTEQITPSQKSSQNIQQHTAQTQTHHPPQQHHHQSPLSQLQHDSDDVSNQLVKPNFRVGSYTTAYMRSETRLGSLAALANYMNDEDAQGEYTTGTDDHHSSFSETAWDDYQEKYNSENYSEGFDSDAARRLLEFGDDYRNFIDSQSDCCSSLSAANNVDSLSPPRMDSLQPNETKIITHDSVVSSVDHARRRRALELEYERRRKTLEIRRKSCQDTVEIIGHNPRSPTMSLSSSANALTPKNMDKFHFQHKMDTTNRKLDFGGMIMSHSAQSLRRTSESDTSTRRRKVDERRRSSRNLEKGIKPIPATSSSSCGDSDDEKEMRNLLSQSRNRLEDTRALKIRCHLLRPEDYAEIINTCRDNIRCLESVLRGPPGSVLSTQCVNQTKDLLGAWEGLLRWSENAAAARKLQEEMITLKQALNRLGNKTSFEFLDTEPSIQIAIEALKNEKAELQTYRTNMLHLNASVHGWLTRQERKLHTALEEQQATVENSSAKAESIKTKIALDNGDYVKSEHLLNEAVAAGESSKMTSTTATITVTDSNGEQLETHYGRNDSGLVIKKPTISTGTTITEQDEKAWDLNSLMNSEHEFHKHLKDEVSDMYTAWDEADVRVNSQLEVLTTSLIAWRQLESGLFEFQQALGQDRGTLKGLEGALDKGQTTPVELAQNVKFMAKLLSEKVNVSQEQLIAVQEHLDPKHILHIAKFTASTGSLSDSGISDGGTTSDGSLSERERRLGVLRRLAKQLETALAPGSDAMKSIAARMESAEAELKNLQNTCRDLIVRTAATHQNKKQLMLDAKLKKDETDKKAQPSHITSGNGYLIANGHVDGQESAGDHIATHLQQSPSKLPSKRKNKRKQPKSTPGAGGTNTWDCKNGNGNNASSVGRRTEASGASDDADPEDDAPLDMNLDTSDDDESDSTGEPPKRGWAWRIVKAAVPLQLALFTFLAAASLLQPNCCDNLNNLSMSFTPQLRYIRGPPPI